MPSPKVLEKKKAVVSQLVDEIKDAESIIFSDYKGLTVAQDTKMRAKLREEGVNYRVVKNSLSLIAMEKLGYDDVEDIFDGPTAIAYSNDDVVLAPRLIREFCDEFKKMEIKGGFVHGERISLDKVMALSRIPTQETLYGQLCFMLLYPLTALAQVSAQIAEKAEEAGAETIAEVVVEESAQVNEENDAEANDENTEETKQEESEEKEE